MPKNIFDFESLENAELRALAKGSVCFLPISIGQKYHTGEAWCDTIRQMNQYFQACIIVPVDGLHRFTEMMKDKNLTEAQAEAIALSDGDKWLIEVDNFNKKLRIPSLISRWSDWVSTAEFSRSKAEIVDSYDNEDSDFRTNVDLVIHDFIAGFISKQVKSKKAGKKISFNLKRATELCKLYLLEELAFVEMLKNKCVSPQVLNFFNDTKVSVFIDRPFFMAYPFGHNSTNQDVYNCFESLCSEKLILTNLSKPPKQSKQKILVTSESVTFKNATFFAPEKNIDDTSSLVVSTGQVKNQINELQKTSAGMHYVKNDAIKLDEMKKVSIFNITDTAENAEKKKPPQLNINLINSCNSP